MVSVLLFSCSEDEKIIEPEPDLSPKVEILSPPDSSDFLDGIAVSFVAEAENHKGIGLQPDALVWVSDQDDTIGIGYSFTREDLSINTHHIVLTGCDLENQCAADEVTIRVTSNTPPEVNIISPDDESSFYQGESITFSGEGTDCEDGLLTGYQLVWTSDRDGEIGVGNTFSTDQLSGQIHHIFLTGYDSDGNTDSDSITIYLTHSMVSVPGVSDFPMGGRLESDEVPVHDVALDPFLIGKFEVTYYLWAKVKTWGESNGYTFANEGARGFGSATTSQHPVVMVTWRDCAVWCNAFSEMEGYTPVYYRTSSQLQVYKDSSIETDIDSSCVDWEADGFRLPAEAEWECAARYIDGNIFSDAATHSGSNLFPDPGSCVWHSGNSGMKTHQVGSLNPNSLELYDMSGNVWEWCWDFYDAEYYSVSASVNPRGPFSGEARTGRGGSWNVDLEQMCYTAERLSHNPFLASPDFGFRLCRNGQ